jgi:hypothetical protein
MARLSKVHRLPEDLVKVTAVARALDVSAVYARELIDMGVLASVRTLDGTRLVRLRDVEVLKRKRERASTAAA